VDYHDVIHPKLKQLCRLISDSMEAANARGIVDTAPLLEREFAQLAGLGWRGKNTLLLEKRLGSYFFLACVLVDVPLPVDRPHESAHCGSCTACLDACPTDAFPSPGVLDATRCISYLTIEHRSAIDPRLRSGIGDWVFGCDVCQEVCPWNRKPARRAAAGSQQAPLESLQLPPLFTMTEDQFRGLFRKTPLWRTRRRGILRNAAIVLGNQKNPGAIPALISGLSDVEPIVRGASAWALGQMGGRQSLEALQKQLALEEDASVREEIAAAIDNGTPS
jgi:epoxyqueuosine reductase